jgi:hypothetical protein
MITEIGSLADACTVRHAGRRYGVLQHARTALDQACSFAFGPAAGWGFFTLFIAGTSGHTFGLCPVAPPGEQRPPPACLYASSQPEAGGACNSQREPALPLLQACGSPAPPCNSVPRRRAQPQRQECRGQSREGWEVVWRRGCRQRLVSRTWRSWSRCRGGWKVGRRGLKHADESA